MTTVTKSYCDRCGREAPVVGELIYRHPEKGNYFFPQTDLCKDCGKEFGTWLGLLKKTRPKARV